MLRNKKILILSSVVILLPILAGLLLWSRLPEQIPVHWNAAGDADGWTSRPFAVFGLPAFLLAIHWVCIFASRLDPRNKRNSSKPLALVLWICPCVSVLSCVLTLGTAMGFRISVEKVVPVFVGLMLFIVGNYLPKCRQSATLGIKLPWTLASEENWNRTHRMAGPLWVIGGLAVIVTGLLGLSWVMLAVIIALVIIPTVYSWHLSRKGV